MTTTIYHNPRCSKSRKTLDLLTARGLSPQVVEYLKNPPDAATLKLLLRHLGIEARQLLRDKEAIYTELNLANVDLEADDLIAAMIDNPILIERPIVVFEDRAVIGRPPENIDQLFGPQGSV